MQAPTLEELSVSGPTARLLSLALRAADHRSRTHTAQRPPGVLQGASSAGPAAGA
jgi:hypothetical protein